MNNWSDYFYFFMLGVGVVLSMLGLWFTAIMPGIDRWSKRFFRYYYLILLISNLSGFIELILHYVPAPMAVIYFVMFIETWLLSLPVFMLTVYLLHACGERLHGSMLLYIVLGLWMVYLAVLVSGIFIDLFFTIMPNCQYERGPLYPLLPISLIAMLLLDFAGVLKRRKRLSRKTFISFLVAILPITMSLLVHLFVDVFPLINISIVVSSISMYSLILSGQIEQDLHHQREIANQRTSIMVLQMRPHFIYNTLMSIYSLCNLDPQKARQVTMDFADYLRKNFNAVVSEDPIPFSAELEHTRTYLAVEQAQYEELLLVEYDTQFTQFRLPPLTLQPIAENAVKHGINPDAGPLHVMISTYRTDSTIVIIVEDNGPGFETVIDSESHSALSNIRKRLELMCEGKLEITPRIGGGTTVTITLPFQKA